MLPVIENAPHHQVRETERSERTTTLLAEAEACTDRHRREQIHDEVVLLNLKVADALAARYARRGVDLDDLTQVARLALVRVVPAFRAEFGRDFLAYAVPSIVGELRKHFRDVGWVVRPPRRLQEAQAAMNRSRPVLAQRLGREPSVAEMATETELSEETLLECSELWDCFSPRSLEAPTDSGDPGGGAALGDLLGHRDEAFRRCEARVVLRPVVDRLTARDRFIVDLRFVEGLTQREIGERLGVTQMQVSRLLTRILADLRLGLEAGSATTGVRTLARTA